MKTPLYLFENGFVLSLLVVLLCVSLFGSVASQTRWAKKGEKISEKKKKKILDRFIDESYPYEIDDIIGRKIAFPGLLTMGNFVSPEPKGNVHRDDDYYTVHQVWVTKRNDPWSLLAMIEKWGSFEDILNPNIRIIQTEHGVVVVKIRSRNMHFFWKTRKGDQFGLILVSVDFPEEKTEEIPWSNIFKKVEPVLEKSGSILKKDNVKDLLKNYRRKQITRWKRAYTGEYAVQKGYKERFAGRVNSMMSKAFTHLEILITYIYENGTSEKEVSKKKYLKEKYKKRIKMNREERVMRSMDFLFTKLEEHPEMPWKVKKPLAKYIQNHIYTISSLNTVYYDVYKWNEKKWLPPLKKIWKQKQETSFVGLARAGNDYLLKRYKNKEINQGLFVSGMRVVITRGVYEGVPKVKTILEQMKEINVDETSKKQEKVYDIVKDWWDNAKNNMDPWKIPKRARQVGLPYKTFTWDGKNIKKENKK